MADLWRDFWIRETGTGQQVAQLHDRYMMMMMMMMIMMTINLNYTYLNMVLTAQRTMKSNWLLLCRKICPAVAQTLNRRPQIAKPKFEPRLIHVRFVENKEKMRQVVLQILLFSLQHHSTNHLHLPVARTRTNGWILGIFQKEIGEHSTEKYFNSIVSIQKKKIL